jgi:hypothetical protein
MGWRPCSARGRRLRRAHLRGFSAEWVQRALLLACLIVLSGCWKGLRSSPSAVKSIEVSYSLVTSSTNGISVCVSMRNNTSKPLTFREGQLAWDLDQMHTTVVLVCDDPPHTQLDRVYYIADPPVGECLLRPAESRSEQVRLDGLFPQLMPYLRDHAVTLFWNYRPETSDGRRFQRVGGWLLIPRGSGGPL